MYFEVPGDPFKASPFEAKDLNRVNLQVGFQL